MQGARSGSQTDDDSIGALLLHFICLGLSVARHYFGQEKPRLASCFASPLPPRVAAACCVDDPAEAVHIWHTWGLPPLSRNSTSRSRRSWWTRIPASPRRRPKTTDYFTAGNAVSGNASHVSGRRWRHDEGELRFFRLLLLLKRSMPRPQSSLTVSTFPSV